MVISCGCRFSFSGMKEVMLDVNAVGYKKREEIKKGKWGKEDEEKEKEKEEEKEKVEEEEDLELDNSFI